MVTKEKVGEALKRAAGAIPGIASYQDKEASRDADKELRMRLSRRLDDLLGSLECFKTDQAKKGAYKHLKEVDDLSRHMEKVSRLLQFAPRGYAGVFAGEHVGRDKLNQLFEFDKGLLDILSELECSIQELTSKGAVVKGEELGGVRSRLGHMEKKIKDRELLLRGS